MFEYLFTFRSITFAQFGAKLLDKADVRAFLLRTPAVLAAQGCGYSLRVAGRDGQRAADALRNGGARFGRIYRSADGRFEEAAL